MKKAIILTIVLIVMIALLAGLLLLGMQAIDNYVNTGSVFGSSVDLSGSFWGNIFGDEIIDAIAPNTNNGNPPSSTEQIKSGGFIFEVLDNGNYSVAIENFVSEGGVLKIPDTFNGKPVTTIKSSVKSNNTITQIIIPDSVTHIGDGAFQNFTALETVIFGENVEHVRPSAFWSCTSLKNVIFNKNLKHIYQNAFHGCTSLEQMVLPDGLKSIQHNAFNGCSSLDQVRIPTSVFHLGVGVFSDCSSLRSIYIPGDNMEELYEGTFQNCTKLEYAELGEGMTTVSQSMFADCDSLKEVKLPSTLQTISMYAFARCLNLEKINVPQTLTTIGSSAFQGTALEQFEIPASLTTFEAAFGGCRKLTLTVHEDNPKYYHEGNCVIERETQTLVQGLENSIIPDAVTTIGSYAFAFFSGQTISLPQSITEIKSYAFAFSEELSEIVLPENIEYIAAGLFTDCYLLKSIVIPEKVTSIAEWAFEAAGIRNIEIKGKISSIGQYAFVQTPIENLTINADNLTLYYGAFGACDELISVTIKGTIKSIDFNAFSGKKLKTINLPKEIEKIKGFVGSLPALEEVSYDGTLAEWEAIQKPDNWGSGAKSFKLVLTDGVKTGGKEN